MNDHLWPSLYPGLIIGVLLGLGFGGMRNMALGAAGGLAGSAMAYFGLRWLMVPEGIVMLGATVAIAVACALGVLWIGRRIAD